LQTVFKTVLGPPKAQGGGAEGQTCTKTFLGQVGMWVQNFIRISAGFLEDKDRRR